MQPPILGIDFVSVAVTDMARAQAFYRDVLGLPPGQAFNDEYVEFDLGDGPALALDASPFEAPESPPASAYLAIAIPRGGPEMAVDPDGNPISLVPHAGAPRLDHVALPVADLARARAFYDDLLGCQPEQVAAGRAAYVLPDGHSLVLDDLAARGLAFAPLKGGMVGLRCPDVQAAFDRMAAKGHTQTDAVLDFPVCRMAFIRDPDGNMLGLHRRHDA